MSFLRGLIGGALLFGIGCGGAFIWLLYAQFTSSNTFPFITLLVLLSASALVVLRVGVSPATRNGFAVALVLVLMCLGLFYAAISATPHV